MKNVSTGDNVFEKLIVSSYSAGIDESFIAVTRLRKANEGAVRNNIEQFIKYLSQLQL